MRWPRRLILQSVDARYLTEMNTYVIVNEMDIFAYLIQMKGRCIVMRVHHCYWDEQFHRVGPFEQEAVWKLTTSAQPLSFGKARKERDGCGS